MDSLDASHVTQIYIFANLGYVYAYDRALQLYSIITYVSMFVYIYMPSCLYIKKDREI